ncbi:MAG: RNase adapter RapZ [Clostridia bacterium]|nr:RNase adapter RapZ [Clostridia bacterium]
MRFVIITGISGAGKTQVLHFLEDMGYYCIDNMPVFFLASFATAVNEAKIKADNVAVVTDARSGEAFINIGAELDKIDRKKCPYEIVFLEADDPVLVHRYKETRRVHPLAPTGSVEEGITKEKEIMAGIRSRADYIINTSNLLTRELGEIVREKFGSEKKDSFFTFNLISFGFKYSLPSSIDLVMDVRFLPNPYYVEGLREKTGLDREVYDYVTDNDVCREFVRRYTDMLEFLMPYYVKDGRRQLTVAIGCTGGKHRSVSIVEMMKKTFEEKKMTVNVKHRDVNMN